jgi:hypothetical protein
MKSYILLALGAPILVACAASGPATTWGKENVSMSDYRLEGALCAAVAAGKAVDPNAANTAGGINGKNSTGQALPQQAGGQGSGLPSGTAFPTGGGGAYRDSASADMVSRAAQQQRNQEMAEQRARTELLRSCLVNHGYTEIRLTAEQRAHLATLPEGSDERREYLHKIGSDPAIIKAGRVEQPK